MALPGSIVQSIALLPGLAIDGVIVLADAETVEERAGDRYMSDTVRSQLASADIIVLNKIDLVPPGRVAAISRWLSEIVPDVRILPAQNADVPSQIILGRQPEPQPMAYRIKPPRHRTAGYDALDLEVGCPVDAERLASVLADPNLALLRAKGFLQKLSGEFVTLHVVGRRSVVEPAPAWVEGPGRLVCIGIAAEMDRSAVLAALGSDFRLLPSPR